MKKSFCVVVDTLAEKCVGVEFFSNSEEMRQTVDMFRHDFGKHCIVLEYPASVQKTETVQEPEKMIASNTCPECNCIVLQDKCTNKYCNYHGKGWTLEERSKAWANHGVEYRSAGGSIYEYGNDYDEHRW
jgi:hypothetical protein